MPNSTLSAHNQHSHDYQHGGPILASHMLPSLCRMTLTCCSEQSVTETNTLPSSMVSLSGCTHSFPCMMTCVNTLKTRRTSGTGLVHSKSAVELRTVSKRHKACCCAAQATLLRGTRQAVTRLLRGTRLFVARHKAALTRHEAVCYAAQFCRSSRASLLSLFTSRHQARHATWARYTRCQLSCVSTTVPKSHKV